MFKKIILACFVVGTFVVYSIHQRDEGARAVQRVAANRTTHPTTVASVSTPAVTYRDGSYTGKSSDAFYGYVQTQAIVSGGKLTNVVVLDYPHDRENSVIINNAALPQLKQQAIQNQSAHVDGVSGATDTSQAFMESLGDALAQAKA